MYRSLSGVCRLKIYCVSRIYKKNNIVSIIKAYVSYADAEVAARHFAEADKEQYGQYSDDEEPEFIIDESTTCGPDRKCLHLIALDPVGARYRKPYIYHRNRIVRIISDCCRLTTTESYF